MQKGTGRYSRPIVSIAILGIILGVAVMILSASIVRGFRTEIRDKVVGFNAHLQITDVASGLGTEDKRVRIDQDYLIEIQSIPAVHQIRPFIARPTILESKEGIEGVIAKGLSELDLSGFLKDRLIAGEMPELPDEAASQEMVISAVTARALDVEVGDRLSLYFIKEASDFSTRRLAISGIYQTDLEEFDGQYIYIDMRHLQRLSNWGLEIQALSLDSCTTEGWLVEARSFGGGDRPLFRWSDGKLGAGPYPICSQDGSPVEIKLTDESETIPDTAFISFIEDVRPDCSCLYRPDSITTTGGSGKYYVGGFEVFLNDFDQLEQVKNQIKKTTGPFFFTTDIIERTPEIFSWLEILDVNIYIIITLMIGVAIFNMSSALLILIIERSNMIGILKALGSENWSVRKIFIRHAGKLILKGLIWGNLVGIGLAMVQKHFQLFKLSAETYYLNRVPILLDWMDLILIDIGTLSICLIAMLVPSYFITRITPVKAIRFD
ncbi:MAG: ABC transporter permease [Flavobacteriales bacterium]|nr:ABC transporter permease [Flavobacteriales bacterium]NNK80599.1 ABC transporter permease [Flavobacteriales bacterium]